MKKILIVEDNAPLCWLIERILRGNYHVTLHDNALDAVAWLTEGNTCDLIITDLQMPGMSGVEFIRFLKQSGLYVHIPVIVLTADETGIDECMNEGAASYLIKPFVPQHLVRHVTENLTRNVVASKS
ncbi:MAG TPA: response regulator [Chryseosolibacter sp.]